jgi:hypothetical protein
MQTEFAMSARDRWVYRHALTILQFTGKFMPQNKRAFQFCVANLSPGKPMQVRAAHTHRLNADELLACPSHRDGLIMIS